jgi:hypothetical protein
MDRTAERHADSELELASMETPEEGALSNSAATAAAGAENERLLMD